MVISARSQLQAEIDENKPRFVKQLKNVNVSEGESATFDCVVVGQPEPEVIWYREEQLIRESTDVQLSFHGDHCSLTLKNTVPQDSGLYKVTARNTQGEATSFCRLNVQAVVRAPPRAPSPQYMQVAPSFAPALHNQTLVEGQRCMFEVRATGEPSPTVVWKFNNQQLVTREEIQVIEAQNNYHRLVIDRVGKEHAGIYSVEAVNAAGEAKSVATLIVSVPPTVVHAKSVTPIHHTSITHTPTPPPRPVQQQYDHHDTIRVVEEYMEKDVQELGISPSATPPEFVRQFQAEYRVEINDKIRMECLLVGNPRPKVQWLFNGRPIVPNTGFCQLTNVGDTYAVILNPVRAEHQGTYQLIAENIRGRTECSTVVTVTEQTVKETRESRGEAVAFYQQQEKRTIKRAGHPPHFTQTLVSVIAADEEEAKFEGVVTGSPSPEVVWTKDGEQISAATHRDIRFSNIGGRVSLTFANARAAHSGKYMCTAKNECGVATSSAQLVIRPRTVAPDFVQRLISKEVAEGDSLRWEVKVTGDPTPVVTWLRDGQPIPHCDEVRLIAESDGRHVLHIVKVEMADCGQFTCLAENAAGEARSTADLVVRPYGTEPGNYFHVTKVTQERQVAGQEVTRNQAFSIEQPVDKQLRP
uniref:Ig-like domain-containing protein n=1 Tax=Plectus sambesii TaxID=2011161 RepID=A0A914WNH9_9BILA